MCSCLFVCLHTYSGNFDEDELSLRDGRYIGARRKVDVEGHTEVFPVGSCTHANMRRVELGNEYIRADDKLKNNNRLTRNICILNGYEYIL